MKEKLVAAIKNIDNEYNRSLIKSDYYGTLAWIAIGQRSKKEFADGFKKAVFGATSVEDAVEKVFDYMMACKG
jgi:hypothetical protein